VNVDISFHPVDHIRETTTPINGLLISDCSCGAEYSVPWGGNEYEKLEQAHAEHIAELRGESQ
jgi:hypothetical protein